MTNQHIRRGGLITPQELAARLDDPRLVVLDCTVTMITQPVGPSIIESGLPGFEANHIPGAQYAHLVDDLSAPHAHMAYGLPTPERITALLRRLGVRQDSTVVLYGWGYPAVVTRAFWVLDVMGVQDLWLLDSGLAGWREAGLPLETGPAKTRTAGDFTARPDLSLLSEKQDMLAGIDDPAVQLLNTLSREQFLATGGAHYGRPGRIPNSLSLPFRDTFDVASLRFHDRAALEQLAKDAGVRFDRKVRIYCGGGIAASGGYFVLRLLGHPDISLYDGSLTEWSNDPELPMVTGEEPASSK